MSTKTSEGATTILDGFFRDGTKPEPVQPVAHRPDPQDLPERWRAKAKAILAADPDHGHLELWKAMTLSPHGGDEHYEGHHTSLMGVCWYAVKTLGLRADDTESVDAFIDHFAKLYDHDNAHDQVRYALNNAFDGADSTERRGKQDKVKFDPSKLRQHRRTSIKTLIEQSPEDIDVSPEDFLRTLFNDQVLDISTPKAKKRSKGWCAVAKQPDHLAMLFDPHEAHTAVDPFENTPIDNLDDFRFFSQGVFIKSSRDHGRRSLDNLAHRPYLTLECDMAGEEWQERFVTFALLIGQAAPLVAVIDSGGKSLHFIFAIHDTPRPVLREFMLQAALHGADRGILKNDVSLIRLPNVGASSNDRREQRLLYYDPSMTRVADAPEWNEELLTESLAFLSRVHLWYCDAVPYYKRDDDTFGKLTDTFAMSMIAESGLRDWKEEGEFVSPARSWANARMNTHSVKEVLKSLAGYHAGVITQPDGSQYLVRYSPHYPTLLPSQEPWDNIYKFLKELFDGDEYDVFLAWLAEGVRASYNDNAPVSRMTPSQFLNIVGEPNAGKSFLKDHILQPLFGNRMAKADGLFAQKDDVFNSMEVGAELLILDDTKVLKDNEPNRQFQGEVVKELCVSGNGESHGKGVDKVSVRRFHRIVRFLNTGKVNTLPLINEAGVGDKVIILKALNRGERSIEWGDQMIKAFKHEMNAFFTYLIKHHETPEHVLPPEELRRFPVVAYKNPEVVDELNQDSKSAFIERLINDGNIGKTNTVNHIPVFEGTSSDLYTYLLDTLKEGNAERFRKMFRSPQRLTPALKELRDAGVIEYSSDGRITPAKIKGSYYYRISLANADEKMEKRLEMLFDRK